MHISLHSIDLSSDAPITLIDVTASVQALIDAESIRSGLVTVISKHTTASVCINEREPKLQQDMIDYLTARVPREAPYRHNEDTLDGRDNAHSHLLALSMNASENIPIVDGKLLLGTWQSVFFVELDGPRAARQLSVQIMGQA